MYDFNYANEIKLNIALIGQSKCGKSSLRELHTGKEISLVSKPSVDINMFDRLEFYEEFSVRLNIWDIPGRRILRPVTQQYIKTSDAVIIMYDTTNKNAYEYTEDLIKSVIRIKQQDDYCCLLFGNKIDLLHQRRVGTDRMVQLSQKYNLQIIEGSVINELNSDKMFYCLTAQCMETLFDFEDDFSDSSINESQT